MRARTTVGAAVACGALALTGGISPEAAARAKYALVTTGASVPLVAPDDVTGGDAEQRAEVRRLQAMVQGAATAGDVVSKERLCQAPSAYRRDERGVPQVTYAPLTLGVGELGGRAWTNPPSPDPLWQLWFHSMRWAQGFAVQAAADHDRDALERLERQVLRFYAENPDRGTSAHGWDEGSSLRRLETLNCLYAVTSSTALKPLMAKEYAVLTGARYYGPPNAPVHNHGLMTNVRILVAARLVGNDTWAATALRRMRTEAPAAFSRQGVTWEQSAQYHVVNNLLWSNAVDVATVLYPGRSDGASLAVGITAASTVGRWLTEPDGKLPQIGDTQLQPGAAGPARGSGGLFRDDATGWAIGRWSWTDKQTTYFTLRYGPRRFAHGHHDKSSLTWSTRGVRVLVGPGYASYDPDNPKNPWWRWHESHNTSLVKGATVNPSAVGSVTSASFTSTRARMVSTDNVSSVKHTRTTTVDHAAAGLTVVDAYAKKVWHRQYWHLGPEWKLVSTSRTRAVLTHRATSRRLVVITDGSLSTATGRHLPTMTSSVPIVRLVVARSGAVTTRFQVT